MSASLLRRSVGSLGLNVRSLVLHGVLFMLVLGPILGLLYQSFSPNRHQTGGLGLANYRAIATPAIREATLNSVAVGVGATLCALIVGGGLAWLVARTDVPGRAMVQIAGFVPLFFSAIVGALAWAALASPRTGYLNSVFDAIGLPITLNIYSLPGIIFVLTVYYSPFAYILIFAGFSLASGEQEGAARVHGASAWRTATTITFPLVAPSIVAAGILIFIIVTENFPVVEILGSFARINFLPTHIFRLVNEAPPRMSEAAALGVLALVVLMALIWFQSRYVHRRSYVTVGGKGGAPDVIRLGRWRWPAFGFAVLYIMLAAVLPLIALALGAFRQNAFYRDLADLTDPAGFTTSHFTSAMAYPPFQLGLRNSVILATAAALVGVVLNFVVAYAAKRRAIRGASAIEYIVLAPVAMPALLLGLSFVTFWLRLPIPLFGTMAILVIAYVARFIPQGFQNFASTLVKIDEQLEDSAVTAGAPRWRALFSITLPLLRSTAFSTGVLLFILAFREVTVALFLYTPDTRPLSVVIYNQWSSGSWARVASMSLIFTAALLVASIVGRRGMRPAG
ncbi:MAG: ABC transporter permease [Acidimicrobiales bacterium]